MHQIFLVLLNDESKILINSRWRYNVTDFTVFVSNEYQKFKYHRYVQKSYVPKPPRAPMTCIIWEQSRTFLIKIETSSFP